MTAVRARSLPRRCVAAAAAGCLGLLLLAAAPPAQAGTSLAGAQAQAAALASKVAALNAAAELAAERYDAATAALQAAVGGYVSADQRLAVSSGAAAALALANDRRARAVYETGSDGLLAGVLSGGSINDVLDGYTTVAQVLNAQQAIVQVDQAAVTRLAAADAALARTAAQRAALATSADSEHTVLLADVSAAQLALATASDQVRALTLALQARQQAAALASAAAQLRTAPVPPVGLPAGTPAVVALAVAWARSRLGDPYVWGGSGPDVFDCSGLVQWSYAHAGLALPRTGYEQWFTGPHPSLAQLLPGDLVFWAINTSDVTTIHHVALYIGDGYIIQAPHTGTVVQVSPMWLDGYIGATRPWATTLAAPVTPTLTTTLTAGG